MHSRHLSRAVLCAVALLAAAAAPTTVTAQAADDFVGVYRYNAGRGPEEVTVTKVGERGYRLEVTNTSTNASRWEALAFFRDGYLAGVVIDRPANGARILQAWRGRLVRPGVLEVTSQVLPGDPNYTAATTWSPTPNTLTKIR